MIELRAIEYKDIEPMRIQRNKFYRYFRQHKPISEQEQLEWYHGLSKDKNQVMFSIDENDKLCGCCGLTYIDWLNKSADMSLYIFGSYIDDRARGAISRLWEYGFNTLGLNKIYADIMEYDIAKGHIFPHICNMHYDGLIRQKYFKNGVFVDSLSFSILRSEYAKIQNTL